MLHEELISDFDYWIIDCLITDFASTERPATHTRGLTAQIVVECMTTRAELISLDLGSLSVLAQLERELLLKLVGDFLEQARPHHGPTTAPPLPHPVHHTSFAPPRHNAPP